MDLPEYRNIVLDSLGELLATGAPYCDQASPLKQETSRALSERLERAKNVCNARMEKFRPRIMLYGVYNSGKSTLLNALLGEKRAAMADIPKTAKSTSYDWHGHEIVDTPGIDAPIEHEAISRETLRSSQIILFVVSAKGSFENNKIYEAMRDVVEQGKRLVIVLNNKDDEYTKEQLADIKDRIQKILEDNGFSRTQAASFRLMLINALYGMEGRLNKDEALVEYSGINELEDVIYSEINNSNGYALVKDSLNYLLADYKYLLGALQDHVASNNEHQLEDLYKLREQYHEFLAGLENDVDTECSNLTEEVRHCFPAPGVNFAGEDIKRRVDALLSDCLQSISGRVEAETEQFVNLLARQGMKILRSAENSLRFEEELGDYEALLATLRQYQEEAIPGAGPVQSDQDDFLGKMGDTATALSTLPLTKLPIPLPIPPVLIPVIILGIKIIASLFGKSAAERENERMEAQIAHEREMAERRARAEERQREEINSYAEDIKTKFVRGVKYSLREGIQGRFRPVLDTLEAQCAATSDLSVKIRTDISRLQDRMGDLQQRISELA